MVETDGAMATRHSPRSATECGHFSLEETELACSIELNWTSVVFNLEQAQGLNSSFRPSMQQVHRLRQGGAKEGVHHRALGEVEVLYRLGQVKLVALARLLS